MKNEDLLSVAKEYMKIWNAKNGKKSAALIHKNFYVHYTHYKKKFNRAEFLQSLEMTHEFFPDLKMKLNEIKTCDNTAIIRWTYTGTFEKGELFGVKAKSQKVQVPGVSFLEFKDGLVVKETGIVDVLSQLIQIGAIKTD